MTHTGSPGYHPMPQGQAVDVRERQCVVQLKEYCDQERRQGPMVSTQPPLGRALQRLGLVSGQSRQTSALRERDEVGIARRAYLRAKRANRHAHGGTVRPDVSLDESSSNVTHATPRTWSCAEDGPWGHKP